MGQRKKSVDVKRLFYRPSFPIIPPFQHSNIPIPQSHSSNLPVQNGQVFQYNFVLIQNP